MFVQQKFAMYSNLCHLLIKYLLIEIPARNHGLIYLFIRIYIEREIYFRLNTKEFIMDYLFQLGHVVINSRCLVTMCHKKTSRTRQTRKVKIIKKQCINKKWVAKQNGYCSLVSQKV